MPSNKLDSEIELLMDQSKLKKPPSGSSQVSPFTSEPKEVKKMTMFQAYFALLKAYCAINILLLPKSFRNGGYALSPLALMMACLFESTCAIKLSQCGIVTG